VNETFSRLAAAEGCDRVEAALWARIALRRGFDTVRDRATYLRAIRAYVEDRKAFRASAETLAAWLALHPGDGHARRRSETLAARSA
jgi:hypothetical protein